MALLPTGPTAGAQVSLTEGLTSKNGTKDYPKNIARIASELLRLGVIERRNAVVASKIFFEQIPVETVKRIAKDFPDENAVGTDGGNTGIQDEAKSPRESWRELAQQVQYERDPNRMIELVEQLITTLDQEQLCNRLPRTGGDGNGAD